MEPHSVSGAHSPIESVWRDNVARRAAFERDHPEWRISQIRPDGWPMVTDSYEASDGVVTVRADDLGRVLDLALYAIRQAQGER